MNNWAYPSPRPGLLGIIDRLTGPGATAAELVLQFLPSLLAAIAVPTYAIHQLSWSPLQLAIASLLAFDIVGGIMTNATSAAKRWYHRPEQGLWLHLGFIAVHGIHLAAVAWLFRSGDSLYFFSTYGYLMVASLIILNLPLYLQRPTAFLFYSFALLLHVYIFIPVTGLEWFLPFLFMKLLVSHLLKEYPYKPRDT
jgi:hypothetical protein